jgi:hypothetical protein
VEDCCEAAARLASISLDGLSPACPLCCTGVLRCLFCTAICWVGTARAYCRKRLILGVPTSGDPVHTSHSSMTSYNRRFFSV